MKIKVLALFIPFLVVCLEQARGQLSLPDMPGPPYPDRFGNNRWGVKYDPRVHGRGRNEHGSPSTAGAWNGPQYSPSSRYRGGPPPPPSRSKWASALKPLVSIKTRFSKNKNKRNRRPPRPNGSAFDPTSDSFYKNSYTSKAIDGYVKNYLNTYNKVSQITPNSDLVSIQNFAKQTNLRPSSRSGNRRSLSESNSSGSSSSTSSLKDIYLSTVGLSDSEPTYRTLDPQESFFGPKISKKKSDFAKTLSTIYNDYKPGGENTASDVSTSSNSGGSSSVAEASTDSGRDAHHDDDYPASYFTIPPEPSRQNRPRPPSRTSSSNSRPTLVERPFNRQRGPPPSFSRGPPPPSSSSRGPPPPPLSSRGRGPPPPPSKSYSRGPLSSLDLHDDLSGYLPGPPPSSFSSRPELLDDYSDSMIITSGRDGPFGSDGLSSPVTRVYSLSRPPPSFLDSSPFDSPFEHSGPPPPPPYSMRPFGGPHRPPPPPNPYLPPLDHAPPYPHPPAPLHAPVSPPFAPPVSPVSYLPMTYPNLQILPVSVSSPSDDKDSKKSKSKRKKKRLQQHTPMNVIRGLLGRGDRKTRHRDEDDDDDDREIFRPAYAANIPVLSLPPPVPPPQYIYSPIVNTLAGPPPVNYRQPLYQLSQAGGLSLAAPPQQASGQSFPSPNPQGGGQPPFRPHGPPPLSPLGAGISALRETLSILRDRPQHSPPPPPPPPPAPPRYQQPAQSDSNKNDNGALGSPGGPITQHIQDWPRIFTAMGTSVDAVAGGIHAVRKEISKMTGKTMAKGIMMGGSAVHEVSKGMAHVITKLSAI